MMPSHPTHMDNEEARNDNQEVPAINEKVDSVMQNLENSKLGRHIPLEIKEIDSRDLEFVALCAKTILFVPSVVLTCLRIGKIAYWYEILVRIVVILDMSFAVTMFSLSINSAFPMYAISALIKNLCIGIYALLICFHNASFLTVVFSILLILFHISIEVVNLFYLKNTVSKYGTEPVATETAEIKV